MADLQVWQNRWDSLSRIMTDLASSYQSATFPRHATFRTLVKCLQAFAQSHFYFFYNSFRACQTKGPKLLLLPPQATADAQDPTFAPEFALGAILEQVSYDLDAIQRAAVQRRARGPMRQVLDQADKLAWQLLKPMEEAGILDSDVWVQGVNGGKTTVVTYFQKSLSIRVIPYAPVAFIGIPFTCLPASRDEPVNIVETECLAIPHEVGHYVYWRSQTFQTQEVDGAQHQVRRTWRGQLEDGLDNALVPEKKWVKTWAEEIFADVFGCFSAGPAMALGCQDRQLEYSDDQLRENDGEHPVPALRPYIYQMALDKIGKTNQDLVQRWRGKLKERNIKSRFGNDPVPPGHVVADALRDEDTFRLPKAKPDQPPVHLSEAKDPLSAVVDRVALLLPNIRPGFDASSDVENLVPEFVGWARSQIRKVAKAAQRADRPIPDDLDIGDIGELWHTWWAKQIKGTSLLRPTPSEDIVNPNLADGDLDNIYNEIQNFSYETLKWVLSARGWTTKGPSGDPKLE